MTYLVGMMSRIRSGTGLLLTNVVPTRFVARMRTARKVAGQTPGEVWRMLLVLFAVLLVWHELATSALQAHLLAGYATRLSWQVAPGPSTSIVFPRGGPFDERRGYSALPRFTHRLERRGYRLMEQSRFSPDLEWLAGLGVPPPDANNRKPAVHGSKHQPMPCIRGASAIGGEPLDDKAGKRRRLQHVSEHGDEIDFRFRIRGAVIVPVAGVLGDRDLGDRTVEQRPVWPFDRHRDRFDA